MRPLPVELQQLIRAQAGVLTLEQLAAHGFDYHHITRRLRNGMWQQVTAKVFLTNSLALTRTAQLWSAALHYPGMALTGRAALELYGLPADPTARIDLVGPRIGRESPLENCVLHTARISIPRAGTSPDSVIVPFAVLGAMAWAPTGGQAVFTATMAIQRRLTTLAELQSIVRSVHGSRTFTKAKHRLALVPAGAESVREVDFVRLCRRRGLPEPRRQVARTDSDGRQRYLDVLFERDGRRLMVEIDGLQHLDAEVKVQDQLRANALTLDGEPIIRIPGVALTTNPEPFMAQLERALIHHRIYE